jgi:hypothetical protein
MSIETDVKVQKLEEAMKEMQFQMSQVMSAIAAMVEVNSSNAVIEGADIPSPEARNGKVKKTNR